LKILLVLVLVLVIEIRAKIEDEDENEDEECNAPTGKTFPLRLGQIENTACSN
jgi:hypothetical protein